MDDNAKREERDKKRAEKERRAEERAAARIARETAKAERDAIRLARENERLLTKQREEDARVEAKARASEPDAPAAAAEMVAQCMLQHDPLHMSNPVFDANLFAACARSGPDWTLRDDYAELMACVRDEVWSKIHTCAPPRSQAHVPEGVCRPHRDLIENIKAIPQAEQRTDAWYLERANMITASSAHKVFGSPSKRLELLREKVCPTPARAGASAYVREDSPLDWGKKFEPASVMYYEKRYGTRLHEYGRIPHPRHDFIGASPDGINDDPASPLYGRMVEIKNIVNRAITGVPKEEYWIQMQLQLEVCGLECCDFLETRYIEHEPNEFEAACETREDALRFGSAAVFFESGELRYEFSPLGLSATEQFAWCERACEECDGATWYKNIHYELTEVSCVTVTRNRAWFARALDVLRQFWSDVASLREKTPDERHAALEARRAEIALKKKK